MSVKLKRENCWLKYSKTLHHVGTFRVVQKKEGNKELRMVIHAPWWIAGDKASRDWTSMTDTNVKDCFVWLGRYLALKGKLPRNVALEELAVGAQRISKGIREVNAMEVFALENTKRSGLEVES